MDFEDILNIESNPTEVILGHKDDELFKLDLNKYTSIIITGSTGTSKSVMINQILLQLIKKNNPEDLKIVSINPTKVELKPYRVTKYSYNSEIDLECHNFSAILNMIEKRISLFKEYSVNNIDEYNKIEYKKSLPLIVLAIDEATFLFKEKEADEKLKWIIEHCKQTGVILLLTTNDLYNDFFDKGYNTLADIRISFPLASIEDSKQANINNCQYLKKNEFLVEIKNAAPALKFNNFNFNDKTIYEILKEDE
jgi:S-DNA-T family DNA segregation ATPase FtsK/SpoIIIE